MAFIMNNLYPPIMPNVIPAFVRNLPCKIYFAISEYNSIKEIANVQITLTNVKTNSSVLDTTLYPTGIKLTTLHYDTHVQGDYCYYVIISPEDLIDKSFQLNQYYKIQMRFTSTNAEKVDISQKQSIAKWLNDNKLFFSEWSRSCLLRGISQPILTINYLQKDQTTQLSAPLSIITGTLSFEEENEEDYLKEYFIKIYLNNKPEKEGLIFNSGNLYSSLKQQQRNNLSCNINCDFEPGASYIIKINYTTKYLYNQQIRYNIKIKSNMTPNPFNIIINTTSNNQNGYIDVNVQIDKPKNILTNNKILLRRSSSKNNFKTWEDVYICDYIFTQLSWQDLSIESGVWYKYSIYILDQSNSILYTPVESQPIMCIFEDIFLILNNIQFKLQFNPSISDFKYNTSEFQQLTAGSKFPYIKRNGNNYYRTFSIGGLVSSLTNQVDWYDSYLGSDETPNNKLFSSKEDIYGGEEAYLLYQNYENKNYINNYLNPYYERFFRQIIYDFLYSEDIKLFKSPTEGNILVKLTNITFEPIASLGRILYSFTATAVEIDEANMINYKKYNIIPDSAFKIVTESPQVDGYKNNYSNIVLVINANGVTQKIDQNWILHLETRQTRGGKLV